MKHNIKRRNFLKNSLLSTVCSIPLIGALTTTSEAAEIEDEYKALVCIILHGGADAFNMIIPTDDALYNEYENVRFDIAVDQNEILPIDHLNVNELNPDNYGFRPEMQGFKNLFDNNELAIIANVGTLTKPTTKNDVQYGIGLPRQLYAHDMQREQWVTGNSKSIETKGVAGKVANLFYPEGNTYFNISTYGNNSFQMGGHEGITHITSPTISRYLSSDYGFGPEAGGAELASSYYQMAKNNKSNLLLEKNTRKRIEKDINIRNDMQGLFDNAINTDEFNGGDIASQLKIVAKSLSVHNSFPGSKKRQVFTVRMGGWDTHKSDIVDQSKQLSDALETFSNLLNELGMKKNVTTFTMSDFGRKVSSNGEGTDHGWGTHSFVMGGDVKGGDIYGKMPLIKQDSPDAFSDRIIPTISVEEYLSPILEWFGSTKNEVGTILPNLSSFPQEQNNFML